MKTTIKSANKKSCTGSVEVQYNNKSVTFHFNPGAMHKLIQGSTFPNLYTNAAAEAAAQAIANEFGYKRSDILVCKN